MDHYTTLGVSKTASTDEIKSAYRRLAKQYHPDRPDGDAERFKQINHAYSIIGDEIKRRDYDRPTNSYGSSSQDFDSEFDPDVHSFFRDIFGASAGFHHSQYATPKNRDLHTTITVDLDTIFEPQQRTLHIKSGRSERAVEVSIPAGVNTGATIRYKGFGQDVLTRVPPGDLIVTIRVREVRGFTRSGNNISHTLKVDAVDAMLGGSVEFENLNGSKILPGDLPDRVPGSQKSNQEHRHPY
jgi:DnaJ-class molecular chaperone